MTPSRDVNTALFEDFLAEGVPLHVASRLIEARHQLAELNLPSGPFQSWGHLSRALFDDWKPHNGARKDEVLPAHIELLKAKGLTCSGMRPGQEAAEREGEEEVAMPAGHIHADAKAWWESEEQKVDADRMGVVDDVFPAGQRSQSDACPCKSTPVSPTYSVVWVNQQRASCLISFTFVTCFLPTSLDITPLPPLQTEFRAAYSEAEAARTGCGEGAPPGFRIRHLFLYAQIRTLPSPPSLQPPSAAGGLPPSEDPSSSSSSSQPLSSSLVPALSYEYCGFVLKKSEKDRLVAGWLAKYKDIGQGELIMPDHPLTLL